MSGLYCCTCNTIATHATYENTVYCCIAGIILKNGYSKINQKFSQKVKKELFFMKQERFSQQEPGTFLAWHTEVH